MKLLFDQNLSFRLCAALDDVFPDSSQLRLKGLERADDLTVWREAREGGFALVTQDADFRDIALVHGAPPKLVLLRCGNQPTAYVAHLLRTNAVRLQSLDVAEDVQLLEIG